MTVFTSPSWPHLHEWRTPHHAARCVCACVRACVRERERGVWVTGGGAGTVEGGEWEQLKVLLPNGTSNNVFHFK